MAAAVLTAACVIHGMLAARALEHERARFLSRVEDDGSIALEGLVTSYPLTSLYGTEFVVSTRSARALVRATRFDLHYGDLVRVHGRLVRTRRTPESLYSDGCVGVVRAPYANVEVIGRGGGSAVRRWFWRAHRFARVDLARRLGSRAGLPLALLVGERGLIDRATSESFARLGISHLLALSGMNLGIVAVLIWWAASRFRCKRRVELGVLAGALVAYVAMVGDVHSLRRALVMALVLVGARFVERPASPNAALGRALFVLLSVAPASLFSVGFQLSFAATYAVIAAFTTLPRAQRGSRWRRWAFDAMVASVAGAWVLVVIAPMQLYYFGEVSVMSPVATVLFLPTVSVLHIGAAVVAPLSGIPLVGDALAAMLGWAAGATRDASVFAARYAPDPLVLPVPRATLYYAGLAVAWKGRRRAWVGAVGIAACAAAFFFPGT